MRDHGGCQRQHSGICGFQTELDDGSNNKASDVFITTKTPRHYAPDTAVESGHMDIRISFDIPEKTLDAVVTHSFTNTRAHAVTLGPQGLTLNGVGFLSLSVTGCDNFEYDGKAIQISWANRTFSAGESRPVTLRYKVSHPVAGMYFDVPSKSYPDRTLHAITDHETERARYWLACVDFPASRSTLRFEIEALKGLKAIANGELASEKPSHTKEGYTTTVYECKTPCPSYLICVAVGDFVSVQDTTAQNVPITYFGPAKSLTAEDLKRSFGRTPKMMDWIVGKLGIPFPWPKYFQIASQYIGGAMENISLVTWSDLYVMDATHFSERGLMVDLTNIHEMAHTYFGDLVVIRHFEHVWLKESWATYFEALWLQENWNQAEFEFEMYGNAERYIAETGRYTRPIVTRQYDHSWAMFDSHTYPGGGWRIHMLRCLLGDTVFWLGVQDYVRTFTGQVVETDDFRKCLEKASGTNFTKFFDQWFYSQGFPRLTAKYAFQADTRVVTIELEQTQTEPFLSHFDVSFDVEVVDSENTAHRVQVTFAQKKAFAVIQLPPKTKVKLIRIDPDVTTLFSLDFNPGEEILEATAKEAKDLFSRIRAYKELIKIGSYSALTRVGSAIKNEPFYGVRDRVANALKTSLHPESIKILGEMVLSEKNPQALFPIVSACSARDDHIRKCLLTLLERPDVPYRSHAAALENLALQRQAEDIPFLISVAKNPNKMGQHGLIRSGAIRALGQTRSMDAYNLLSDLIEHPELSHERCRPWLFTSLAACAIWLGPLCIKRATETIVHGLSEDSAPVRWRCVLALTLLEAKNSISSILESEPLWDARDFHAVRRQIRNMRESVDGGIGLTQQKVKEMMKSIEDLESRLYKMEMLNKKMEAEKSVTQDKKEEEKK